MIFDINSARYVLRVVQAVVSGTIGPDELTNTCPECDRKVTRWENDGHAVVDTNSGPEPIKVIIGCEGYWMVDPSRVGLPKAGWMNQHEQMQVVTPDGVHPGTPDAPVVFMSKQDVFTSKQDVERAMRNKVTGTET